MKDVIKVRINARGIIRGWLTVWAAYFLLLTIEIFSNRNNTAMAGSLTLLFRVGQVLTLPVFILFYQGKTKDSRFNPIWIVYACIAAWSVFLLSLVAGEFIVFPGDIGVQLRVTAALLGLMGQIGGLLILPSLAVAFLGLVGQRDGKKVSSQPANLLVVRSVAGLVIAALLVGTYAAIHTLWLTPEHGKFIYNNLANGLGFGSVILILLLSYLQRDVYWISRGRLVKLDERQLQERQWAFETSYKIGTALVFAMAYELYRHEHSIPSIVSRDSMTPGDMFWPFVNLALALFVLPLVVAAYGRRRANG